MALPLTADFEAGTNGNNVLTSDAGSASAWEDRPADANVIYSNEQAAHGTLAGKVIGTSGNGYAGWLSSFGTQPDHYGRLYMYRTANPINAFDFVYFDTASSNYRMRLGAGGLLSVMQNTTAKATGAVSISLNQWVRIEWHFLHHATTGILEAKLFNTPESASPDETITFNGDTSSAVGATDAYFGNDGGTFTANSDYWLDTIVVNNTGYPGPAVAASAFQPKAILI